MPRRLGQHFLVRESILERLAEAACGEHAARVIEIGPGRGALTRQLLARTDELHAIEVDAALAEYLREKFAGDARLQVHTEDVLAADLAQWGAAAVAGNLPYYITSPILQKFLELDARFPVAVFLMQWEVAERLLAEAGSRAYGFLTVAVRLVCDVELIARVPPSAFVPPPKVDSAAVRLRRKVEQPARLREVVQFAGRAFAHKRKTLRNNLRPFYGERIDGMAEAGLRAEQLSIERLAGLFERLESVD